MPVRWQPSCPRGWELGLVWELGVTDRMQRLTVLIWTGMLLAVSVMPAAAQGGRDDDRVCFYRDVQYQGQAWCYRPGDELADLRDRRNEISSLRIFGRARVVVFDEREFLGASDEFDMDVADLTLRNMDGRRTWNDRIDSFEITLAGRGRGLARGRGRNDRDDRNDDRDRDDRDNRVVRNRICVYEGANYQGRSQCWDAGEEETNLNRTNGWNDQISSIRVFGRTTLDIYRDAEFRGPRLRLNGDVSDLGPMNWGDQISSFQVR
jgi:hypothetical protein